MNNHYFLNIAKVLGLLLMPFSLTMLTPIIISLIYRENIHTIFLSSTIVTLLLGFAIWYPNRHLQKEIYAREGFLIVTLLWLVLSIMGSLPFILYNKADISIIDAIFETLSGLTTTGATTLSYIELLPKSLLYYRQQLQFIGGGGIIILGIAVLPMLSVGGMQLFRAEMTGPFKEEKIAPRVAQTAKTLWYIYVGLTVLSILSFWVAGMTLFDAISYGFATISTGGFATHNQSFEYFNSPLIETLAMFFLLLGAINFSLHFIALRRGSVKHYWKDPECNTFLWLWLIASLLVAFTLLIQDYYETSGKTLIKSFFNVTSFFTTTGFYSADIDDWPTFLPFLLLFLALLGGSSGSTAGGIKIIRLLLLKLQAGREIQRLIHPSGYSIIKLGHKQLHHRTLDAIWAFFFIFVAVFVVLLLLLLANDLDFLTAFSALSCCLSNTGIGLGAVAENFKTISDPSKIILSIAMLAGRLELFTLLVLFSPSYWRN